jgi:hypothetical protein
VSLSNEMEQTLLSYFANDDSNAFQSLTTIFEKMTRPSQWRESFFSDIDEIDDKEQLRTILDQMVIDGLLQTNWGGRDYEGSYRATDQGRYEAAFDGGPLIQTGETRLTDGSDLPTDFLNDPQPRDSDPPYPGRVVEPHDSTTWTGSQFVLVNATVIVKIKAVALELQAAAYSLNFRSDADRDDIQGLVDALVAITRMAEPEVNVIQRILASPKFKTYTSLFGIIATFRGAVGI